MIIKDISTVYEMPEEAVNWINRMIDYTVAGGKMNRGLAMMSAYKTLVQSKGEKLTIKVRVFFFNIGRRKFFSTPSDRDVANLLHWDGASNSFRPSFSWPMM